LRKELGLDQPGNFATASQETLAKFRAGLQEISTKWPGADVSTLVDHIEYAVNLIGVNHVGISSDFQGGGGIAGWQNAAETMNVTAELLKRGYSESEVYKIWGGNLLRVMEAVESVAAQN
jgi:membrane dipeptidase